MIAVGDRDLLLYHEQAFAGGDAVIEALRARLPELVTIEVRSDEVSVEQAVDSYLFNSQILSLPDGRRLLVVAQECEQDPAVWRRIQRMIDEDTPIDDVRVFDLRQSMRNGGGPACLRLRVVLTEAERAAVAPGCWVDGERLDALEDWVRRHYRDRLSVDELRDPSLLRESRTALDELTQLLGIGHVYEFQHA